MKTFLSLLLTVSLLWTFAETTSCNQISAADTQTVYICTGGSATKFHCKANCRGLNNCKGSIVKTTRAAAEKQGRTPCKICKP